MRGLSVSQGMSATKQRVEAQLLLLLQRDSEGHALLSCVS
jgi:hypothetical protein